MFVALQIFENQGMQTLMFMNGESSPDIILVIEFVITVLVIKIKIQIKGFEWQIGI